MSYFPYLKKINFLLNYNQKKSGIYLIFFMFISMCLEILSLGALLGFLNNLSLPNTSELNLMILNFMKKLNFDLDPVSFSVFLFLIVFTLFVLKSFVLIFVAFKEGKFIYYLRAYFSKNLFLSYQRKPYEYFFNINSSKIVNNITVETTHLTIALLALSKILLEVITFVGILIFLLFFDFKTSSVIILFSLIFAFIIYLANTNVLVKLGKDRVNILNKRLKVVQEVFGNIKITKLKNKQDDLYNTFLESNFAIADNSFKSAIRNAVARPLFEIFVASILFIFLFYYLINDKSLIQIIPSLGVYFAAGYRIIPSLVRIITSFQLFQYNIQSVNPIFLDFDKDQNNNLSKKNNIISEKKNNFSFNKSLVLKNVSYSYEYKERKTFVLEKINLILEKNKHIGIIGETGSGKSTMVDLILGLIKPKTGEIIADGINIHSNIEGWQSLIGYVPQDIFLNDSSIKKNIAYGVKEEKIDDEKIYQTIESANILDFVKKLPAGINTELGEKGIKLSGGQKQRIAIARALYFNPKIIIFDEATSSLDFNTESNIIQGFEKLKKDKTLISITHRTNTLLNCDKIYEIKNGNLLEKKDYSNV